MQASTTVYSVNRDRPVTTAGYYPHSTYARVPTSAEFYAETKHHAYVEPPIHHYPPQSYCPDTSSAAAAAAAAAAAGLPNTSLPPLSQLLPPAPATFHPPDTKHQPMAALSRSGIHETPPVYFAPAYGHDQSPPSTSALPAHKVPDAMMPPAPQPSDLYPTQRPPPALYFIDPNTAAAAAATAVAGIPPPSSNYHPHNLHAMPANSLPMFPTPQVTTPVTVTTPLPPRHFHHGHNPLPSPPPSVVDSMHADPQKVFSFVSLPGVSHKKRPRRKYHEVERLYHCNYPECTKAYGTLNHLNAHVCMQNHGPKRHPGEFKELRKFWRKQKREQQQQQQPQQKQDPHEDSPTMQEQQQHQQPNTLYRWGDQQHQQPELISPSTTSSTPAGYSRISMREPI